MEERRYVIKECPIGGDMHNFSIPESVLRWRYLVASNARVTDDEWSRIRNILLHGEIEKHYIIREWGQADPPKGWDVTEDELLSRLATIRLGPTLKSSQWIKILLHGESEKESDMGERRFVIKETSSHGVFSISESEFCRRFDVALERRMKESTPTKELLPIFIRGEGEKGEESQFAPKDVSPYTRVFGIDDQPSPTPSREEWEEPIG